MIKIGLDVGSTTAKMVAIDEDDRIIYSTLMGTTICRRFVGNKFFTAPGTNSFNFNSTFHLISLYFTQ